MGTKEELEAWRMRRYDVEKFDSVLEYLPKKGELLDYACNVGTFVRYIREKYPEIKTWGTDISVDELDHAIELDPDSTYFHIDEKIDKKFDILTMMEVVEHLPNTEQYFQEVVRRYLKDGGHLVITTPREVFPQGQHIQIWDYNRLFTFMWYYIGTDNVSFKYHPGDNTMLAYCKVNYKSKFAVDL